MIQPLNRQRPRTGQQAAYRAALCDRLREPVTPAVNVTTEPVNEPVKAERQPVNEPVKSRTGQQTANRSSEPVNSPAVLAMEERGAMSADRTPLRHAHRPDQPRWPEATWDSEMLAELGRLLESARLAAGLTVADLGPVAGEPSTLRQIEQGRFRTRPSRLRPWLEHLGLDPDPVLERFAPVIAPERADGRTWHSARNGQPVMPAPRGDRRRANRRPRHGVGAELTRLRMGSTLSHRELARAIGASAFTVLLVEHGLRRPSQELVRRWLDAVAADHLERAGVLDQFPGLISSRTPRETGLGWHRAARAPRNGAAAEIPASPAGQAANGTERDV